MKIELVCTVLGDVVHLTKSSVIVGRGSEADLRIDDRDVSRKHCEILVRPDGIVVRDLGSTHGTWYEGRRIEGEIRISKRSRIALSENGVPVEIVRASIDGRPVIDPSAEPAVQSRTVSVSGASSVAAARRAAPAPAPSAFLRGFLVGAAAGLVIGLVLFL